jgi:hypothetical protein
VLTQDHGLVLRGARSFRKRIDRRGSVIFVAGELKPTRDLLVVAQCIVGRGFVVSLRKMMWAGKDDEQ